MHEIYENPLCRRYAGREMQEIFSDDRKFSGSLSPRARRSSALI